MPLGEYRDGDESYIHGGKRRGHARLRNSVRKDHVPDPLGSTVALLDNTLTVTDSWEYWPYGETRSGGSATAFTFVGTFGYYKDTGSRTYVRARNYRQNLGRWQTVDPQ